MARRVVNDFRGLPRKVRDALADSHGMASSKKLNYLKSHKLKPVTPLTKINKIAKSKSKSHNVPIHVSSRMPKGFEKAEGIADYQTRTGKMFVRIHPILQYKTEKHIKSVIDHELDHINVYRQYKKHRESKRLA